MTTRLFWGPDFVHARVEGLEQWAHVCVVLAGGQAELHVDGSVAKGALPFAAPAQLRIQGPHEVTEVPRRAAEPCRSEGCGGSGEQMTGSTAWMH